LGHHSTHFGDPPHKSHFTTIPLLGWNINTPTGQAEIQFPHPTHLFSFIITRLLIGSLMIALFLQALAQGGSGHCLQKVGTSIPDFSDLITLIRDNLGLEFFSLFNAQIFSHILQPTHMFEWLSNSLFILVLINNFIKIYKAYA
jgi:hypothetical protein